MPVLFRDFTNELVLNVVAYLSLSDLYNLCLVSHRFSSLLFTDLRNFASQTVHAKVALHTAVLTQNRSLAHHILTRAESITVVKLPSNATWKGSSKLLFEEVIHRSPEPCSNATLAWIMEQGRALCLKNDYDLQIDAQGDTQETGCQTLLFAVEREHHSLLRLVLQTLGAEDFADCKDVFSHAKCHEHYSSLDIILAHMVSAFPNEYQKTINDALMTTMIWGTNTGHRSGFKILPMLEYLLSNGADPKTTMSFFGRNGYTLGGETVLTLGVSLSGVTSDVIQLFVDQGIDLDASDSNGVTALHKAVARVYPRGSGFQFAKILLDNGADINKQNCDGDTPLMRAVRNSRHEVAELLLQRGANAHFVDKSGKTALHLAADVNRGQHVPRCMAAAYMVDMLDREEVAEVVRRLLEYGADANARDKQGRTPLHLAAARVMAPAGYAGECPDWSLVTGILKDGGADVSLEDNEGRTPYSWVEAGESPFVECKVVH